MLRAGPPGAPALWLVHALGESSRCFAPLLSTPLANRFELIAPDLPGFGGTPADARLAGLDAAADWLAQAVAKVTAARPIGVVGHSLGAAIGVRATGRIAARTVGFFSIEGNLTESDAYLSGQAARFEAPEEFRDHLLRQVEAMAASAPPPRREALQGYLASLKLAASEALWRLGRSAKAASADDALGDEYRALALPTLYFWSPENTPAATQEYLRRHAIEQRTFSGGHWPMVERPEATAEAIRSFFEPLFSAR